jgi:predicted PurR-regulated permease PerM
MILDVAQDIQEKLNSNQPNLLQFLHTVKKEAYYMAEQIGQAQVKRKDLVTLATTSSTGIVQVVIHLILLIFFITARWFQSKIYLHKN